MHQFWNELRRTARTLATSKGFAVAIIATLSAAVALETTTLSVVNAYLVRSLPYPAADRLYRVSYAAQGQREPRDLELVDWSSLSDVVEEQVAWDLDVFYMMGGEFPEYTGGQWVTAGFMRGLGVRPAIGRTFRREDFESGTPQVALISDDLWRRRFNADPAVLGRRFYAYVSDRPRDPDTFTIVGVLPATFWHFNPYTQILTPLRAATYPYFVRIRSGVAPALVEARMTEAVRRMNPALPDGWRVQLESVHAAYTKSVRPLLMAIGAAVTLVLLIACANVALLMMLRGMKRRTEVAIRVALGASERHIARLLLGESLLLCGAASVAGLGLAFVILRALGPTIEQQLGRRVPGGSPALAIDIHVALVVALLTVAMALATALPPILIVRRRGGNALGALGAGSQRSTDGLRVARARALLISLQIAGSFGLLAGCGLMVRALRSMLDVPLGMTVERTVQATLATREQRYTSAAARVDFYDRLLSSLRQTRDIGAVALSNPSPIVSFDPRPVEFPGAASSVAPAAVRAVTADYFATLGIAVREGRAFTAADRPGAEPVAIVSASLARAIWPKASAIGQRLRAFERGMNDGDSSLVARAVVGVVDDVRQSPTDAQVADVYVPLVQAPTRFAAIVVKSRQPTRGAVDLATSLRRTVKLIDPEATVGQPQALSTIIDDQVRRPRFLLALFGAFGLFAGAIGVLGVYAVTGYSAQQREREIAVRIAVGAERRSVVRMFLRQAARQLTLGLALGLFAAWGMGRLLMAQLFGTSPIAPVTLGVIAVMLTTACGCAVAWPAWRASGLDPTTSLRAP